MQHATTATTEAIRLWDWPVRLVHWSFVVLLGGMWWSAENHRLDLHVLLGEVFLGLLVFRVLWGFFGSEPARFSRFVRGPAGVIGYIRGKRDHAPGHNPLGGWSVIAMLALLGLQIGLGMIAQDTDGLESGPLSYLVSYDTADAARELHEVVFNGILALVGIHVLAILFYLFVRRDNLVRAMVTGKRRVPAGTASPTMGHPVAALVCLAVAAGVAWWVSLGAPLP